MSEYIHLIGSEDVRSSGHQIASAASDMNHAVSNMDNVFLDTKDLWMIG